VFLLPAGLFGNKQGGKQYIYDAILHSPLSTFNMVNRLLDELQTLEKYQMKGMCQQPKK
jgi:hypothetical protein